MTGGDPAGARQLHVALIGGPMYDPLYQRLAAFQDTSGTGVQIVFRGDHASLNAHLASFDELPYDLVSTHTKYAPSQAGLLAPLNGVLAEDELKDFTRAPLELATIGGYLYGLPRNVDVRLLHYRTDLLGQPPATWDELLRAARALSRPPDFYGFVFPGKGSGLFGTFYELCEMAGARLFPADLVPDIVNDGGRWALEILRTLYRERLAPPELADCHYDEVHDCFRLGRAAMTADWPGYYALHRDAAQSRVAGRFALAP